MLSSRVFMMFACNFNLKPSVRGVNYTFSVPPVPQVLKLLCSQIIEQVQINNTLLKYNLYCNTKEVNKMNAASSLRRASNLRARISSK